MNNLKMQSAAASANQAPVTKIPTNLNHNHQLVQQPNGHVYARSTSRPKESSLHLNKLQAMLGKSTGVLNPLSTRNSQVASE